MFNPSSLKQRSCAARRRRNKKGPRHLLVTRPVFALHSAGAPRYVRACSPTGALPCAARRIAPAFRRLGGVRSPLRHSRSSRSSGSRLSPPAMPGGSPHILPSQGPTPSDCSRNGCRPRRSQRRVPPGIHTRFPSRPSGRPPLASIADTGCSATGFMLLSQLITSFLAAFRTEHTISPILLQERNPPAHQTKGHDQTNDPFVWSPDAKHPASFDILATILLLYYIAFDGRGTEGP